MYLASILLNNKNYNAVRGYFIILICRKIRCRYRKLLFLNIDTPFQTTNLLSNIEFYNISNFHHSSLNKETLHTDTERLYTEAFNRVTNPHGKTFTWEHKARTMGFQTSEVSKWVVENLELPLTPKEFEGQLIVLYEELFPQANFVPGDFCFGS